MREIRVRPKGLSAVLIYSMFFLNDLTDIQLKGVDILFKFSDDANICNALCGKISHRIEVVDSFFTLV